MDDLWRGSWATRLRIASGLVLFVYALTHFLNIGLGMVSADLMDRAQDWRQVVTRSVPGTFLLYGAFLVHMILALARLAGRGTLRMPFWEAAQIVMGITIPILLVAHLIHTRTAHEIYDVNDELGYIMLLIYNTADGWKQSALLLIVWLHGCVGMHFWLRSTNWWRAATPILIGCAVLIPAFALTGFLVEGRRISASFADPAQRDVLIDHFNFPFQETFVALIAITKQIRWAFAAIIAVVVGIYVIRHLRIRKQSVRINYVNGPKVLVPKGITLLEMSRLRGVPHASLCGGRGRCTTCRVVVEEGAHLLHPPKEAEASSLAAVDASPNTRLACQIRPVDPTTVFRVFQPDGRSQYRSHASQGEEKELALLFLDMRGFTARTTGQLPYDVVFLLNRFFDAIVPAIDREGGSVDKYLGDGFLAVFETTNAASSAKAALRAIQGVGEALEEFNITLQSEGQRPLAIGIGAHFGDVVLGEIGAEGQSPRTLIGNTVNTASRIEGVTKDYDVEAFISAPLLARAGEQVPAEDMIALELRGLNSPLPAWPVKDVRQLEDDLAKFAKVTA